MGQRHPQTLVTVCVMKALQGLVVIQNALVMELLLLDLVFATTVRDGRAGYVTSQAVLACSIWIVPVEEAVIAPPTLVPVAQAGIMTAVSMRTVLDNQTVTIMECVMMLWTHRSASVIRHTLELLVKNLV